MATTTNLGLKKPAYTDAADVADINDNMDIIDQFAGSANEAIANLQDGIAIVANGNTHAAIPANYFVYVKGHGTLSDGLYKNTSGSTIAANATLSSSNLTADTDGGLNTLYNKIGNLPSLTTSAKTNLVSALNEIGEKISNSSETFKFVYSVDDFDDTFTNSPVYSTCLIRVSKQLSTPFTSNNFVGIQWKNGNGNYGMQIVTGFGSSGKVYFRDRNAGNWANWVQV